MLSFKKVVMRKDYANQFPINHFLCQKFDLNTNFHVNIYVTVGANGACHNETKCCLVYNIAQKMKGIVDTFLSQFGKAVHIQERKEVIAMTQNNFSFSLAFLCSTIKLCATYSVFG